jgi:hypothetical protein
VRLRFEVRSQRRPAHLWQANRWAWRCPFRPAAPAVSTAPTRGAIDSHRWRRPLKALSYPYLRLQIQG